MILTMFYSWTAVLQFYTWGFLHFIYKILPVICLFCSPVNLIFMYSKPFFFFKHATQFTSMLYLCDLKYYNCRKLAFVGIPLGQFFHLIYNWFLITVGQGVIHTFAFLCLKLFKMLMSRNRFWCYYFVCNLKKNIVIYKQSL